MAKLTKVLTWMDKNLVRVLFIGLIFFIPLYPKFPIKIVDRTYIGFRFDDIYVSLLYLAFIVQVIRKKIIIKKDLLFYLFISFWISGFISTLYGIYFVKSIEFYHIGYLHALRRIQYMGVFFIAITLTKSKKDFFQYLSYFYITLFIVLLYALGQKYLGFPAVQTMNPEYSHGRILYLTPEARVSSTFGGHYDLAAYIVLFIPIILGFYLYSKKIFFIFLFIFSIALLFLTASRVSFVAFLVSLFSFLIVLKRFKYLAVILIMTAILTFSAKTMTARWLKTLQIKQIFVNQTSGLKIVPEKIRTKELPAGTLYIEIDRLTPLIGEKEVAKLIKPEAEKTAYYKDLIMEKLYNDIRTQALKRQKTVDNNAIAQQAASIAATLKPVYTLTFDISSSTRLQVEWPRAINAFLKHPLLGTGPSSITEATDNDYLRSLGEFGLLGTSIFVYILFLIIKNIWQTTNKITADERYIYFGFIFGFFALLVNATYIDIFEASKVAYTFWTLAGVYTASLAFVLRD